ncbi:MAG TPA: endonuclease/exonuclease/phosphatase family protein [Vicinamibacterales bacterium]
MPFRHAPTSLSVLVFNIHAGKDAAGKDSVKAIADLVRSLAPDLVLLQEVDRGTKRSGNVDQLQAFIDNTRYPGVFGRSLDYDGGTYGIAALSRRGFVFDRTWPLPVQPAQQRAGGSHEPRVALLMVAQTALGNLQAATTHIDASGTDEYRLQEAAELLIPVKARLAPDRPVLIGGDFNAEPNSAVIKRLTDAGLRDAWAECGQGDGLTYPAIQPRKRIDYVFLTGSLRCTAARVIDTQISDHRPLLVTFTM